jgi:branched-chain amino acid transport system permease protein
MFGQQISSNGVKQMFDTKGYWNDVFLFVLALAVIFILLKIFVFKLFKNRDRAQSITINIMVALGIIFLVYRVYVMLDQGLPEVISAQDFLFRNIFNQTLQISVLALATTGIVLIFKTSTTTNFAQGMIATFGAFVAAKIIQRFAAAYPEMTVLNSVLLAMAGGAIVAFVLGMFIDVVIIRNSKDKTPVGKQMITMGLVLILSGAMPVIFGKVALPIQKMSYDPNIEFNFLGSPISITVHAYYAFLITVGLIAILFAALRFTKWGLGVRATASNEVVAGMMGVNTRIITAMSWAIAGLLGAVAAVVLTPNITNVSVAMMTPTQVNAFMAAILGSFSSFAGPLVASAIIPILTSLFSLVVPLWQNAIVYLVILAIVLVKPIGLFGKKVAKKV